VNRDSQSDLPQGNSTLSVLESCADWAWEIDQQRLLTYISASITQYTGYETDQYIGRQFAEVPGIQSKLQEHNPDIYELIKQTKPFRNLYLELSHPDGRIILACLNGYPLFDADNKHIGFRGIGMAVSDKITANFVVEKIKESVTDKVGESYFNALTQALSESLKVDCALVGRMDEESKQAIATLSVFSFGESVENFSYDLADTPDFVVSCSPTTVTFEDVQKAFPNDARLHEMDANGYVGTPLYDGEEQFIGLLIVITKQPLRQKELISEVLELFADRTVAELKRALTETRLVHQAYSDSLTGLANRPLAMDRLDHAVRAAHRAGRRLYVLFLDLDGFKTVNDTMGHVQGDLLLREVASRFSSIVREGETLARLGGDEFLVILEETEIAAGEYAAKRLLDSLQKPIELEGREFSITASIGVTQFPEDGDTPEVLMRNADTAMYQAKNAGRNTYRFFTSEMNELIRARIDMEAHLWQALEWEEFRLFYQPIVELTSGRIVAAEALVRWDSQDLGFLSPERFIPLAEEIGAIVPLGEWIMKQACMDCKTWRNNFSPSFAVAVNVSPKQFRERHILGVLDASLADHGLKRDAIQLEVTETLLMQDLELAQSILAEVTASGTSVSIDDFGTGYSSLSYLKDFPFTTLKIDQSFVSKMKVNAEETTLVSTMIAMAHNLDLAVIAEGIETPHQLSMLAKYDCEMGQGYYFSEPLSADDFQLLLYKGVKV